MIFFPEDQVRACEIVYAFVLIFNFAVCLVDENIEEKKRKENRLTFLTYDYSCLSFSTNNKYLSIK